MENQKKVVNFEREMKKAQIKAWFRSKANSAANWLNENKETIIVLGPVAIGAVTTLVKVVGKNVNLRKEKDVKELYCYDRSLGHYWRLRRELSNAEWVQIDKRKNNGERLADILSALRVLK